MLNYTIKKRNLLLILVIMVVVLFLTMRAELKSIVLLLFSVKLTWLLPGILCIALFWLLEAGTFHIMLNANEKKISYREVLKLAVSTQFFNGITPFSSGGQPFQIFVLTKVNKINPGSATGASIHNFIVYQIILVFMGALAIISNKFFHIFPSGAPDLKWLALGGFLLNLGVIFALIIIAVSPGLTKKIIKLIIKIIRITPLKKKIDRLEKKINNTVEEFHKDIKDLMKNKKILFQALLLNFLKLILFYTIAYFISRAIGIQKISLLQAIVSSAYVMLLTSIIPLPGASGGAELGFLMFFSSFIPGSQGKAVMLLWRFITYYLGLVIGFLTFAFGYTSSKSAVIPEAPNALGTQKQSTDFPVL